MKTPSSRSQDGFSLVEMAIVLVIVGLLLGGLMMTLGAQQKVQQAQETRRLLSQAREALFGFAMQTGRLPCPADPALASGVALAGLEQDDTPTGCSGGQTGVLPWATLGLPETDAWGRRFTYRVSASMSRDAWNPADCVPPTAPTAPTVFALCSVADNDVDTTAAPPVSLASDVPAVIVSHGPNGFGASLPTGAVLGGATGGELSNSDGDALFVDGEPTDAYDDMITWLSTPVLMNRMVQSGRLP